MSKFDKLSNDEIETLLNAIDVCNTECDNSDERDALTKDLQSELKARFKPEKIIANYGAFISEFNEMLGEIKNMRIPDSHLMVDFVNHKLGIYVSDPFVKKDIMFYLKHAVRTHTKNIEVVEA